MCPASWFWRKLATKVAQQQVGHVAEQSEGDSLTKWADKAIHTHTHTDTRTLSHAHSHSFAYVQSHVQLQRIFMEMTHLIWKLALAGHRFSRAVHFSIPFFYFASVFFWHEGCTRNAVQATCVCVRAYVCPTPNTITTLGYAAAGTHTYICAVSRQKRANREQSGGE